MSYLGVLGCYSAVCLWQSVGFWGSRDPVRYLGAAQHLIIGDYVITCYGHTDQLYA
ncbi:hypothetical protein PAXRUDRAFT_832956 [Paxillus rubicundulus Ve08.2h10]|uniref:Uncharacterized protein n=1 Tax=Paxillus rubicundulus Ve08.2h10 TaxID=930991 RepID=A0A0D0CEY4_9AGAM|nr:hypothetical protein PAXRUDRAFT_832956 [Paxillus rubicundulus Ve08.2h10]